MRRAVCPSCHRWHDIVAVHAPRSIGVTDAIRTHGSPDDEVCPGSGAVPPSPPEPKPGWRVVLQSFGDGPVVGGIHFGDVNAELAAQDAAELRRRFGGGRSQIETLSAAAVAAEAEIGERIRARQREMDQIAADVTRERR